MLTDNDLGRIFVIEHTLEFWRFVIAELKQQEAWYTSQATGAAIKNQQSLQDESFEKSEKCSRAAREISRQIEGQKQG